MTIFEPISSAPVLIRIGAARLGNIEWPLLAAVIDAEHGDAYFGSSMNDETASVIKVKLGEGALPPKRDSAVRFEHAEESVYSSVIDVKNGYAYFGDVSKYIVMVKLGSPPTRSGALALENEAYFTSAVIDEASGIACFGAMDPAPGQVVKLRLGTDGSLPTRSGSFTIEHAFSPQSAVIDASNKRAYFGTMTSPGTVIEADLGKNPEDPPSQRALLRLNRGEDDLRCAVIDADGGYAYFGTNTSPGRVVKIRLSDFKRVGAVTLDHGEDHLTSAVIDVKRGIALFGTNTAPGRIVMVTLGEGDDPPRRTGSLKLSNESHLRSAVIDPANGFAYFGGIERVSPFIHGVVVKVGLKEESQYCLKLQGYNTPTHSYVKCGNKPDLHFSDGVPYTLMTWARLYRSGSGYLMGRLVGSTWGGGNTPFRGGYCMLPLGDRFRSYRSGSPYHCDAMCDIEAGRKYFIVSTFEDGVLSLYIDGDLKQKVSGYAPMRNPAEDAEFLIGTSYRGYLDQIGSSLYGDIWKAAVFNTALSQDDIRRLMPGNLSRGESHLVALWDFSTNSVIDQTGNGHDGTLMGNATLAKDW